MKNINVMSGKIFIEPTLSQNVETSVNEIENYLGGKTKDVCVDLRKLNMFDAIRIGALISTHILTRNLGSKIELLSNCKDVIDQLKILSLSNVELLFEDELALSSKVVV